LELLLILDCIYGDKHVNENLYNIVKVRTTFNVRTYRTMPQHINMYIVWFYTAHTNHFHFSFLNVPDVFIT